MTAVDDMLASALVFKFDTSIPWACSTTWYIMLLQQV